MSHGFCICDRAPALFYFPFVIIIYLAETLTIEWRLHPGPAGFHGSSCLCLIVIVDVVVWARMKVYRV